MKKSYKIRIVCIFLAFIFLYTAIIINLSRIQIWQHGFFTNLGDKQYSMTITKNPPRAAIYDRTKTRFLALNKDSISAFIVPNNLKDADGVKRFLKKHFPDAAERLAHSRDSKFMYVKRKLSDDQIEFIAKSNLPDIQLLHEPTRFYPLDAAAQIIGITDIDNHGLAGIELQFNTQLSGTPTTLTLEKDARSGRFYFKKETTISGTTGMPIYLSIDSDLQFLVQEELQKTIEAFHAREGSVIVMNPLNGEIVAMVSYPTFDSNGRDAIKPESMKSKCITEAYELGSVIKVFAALAALEEEVVTLDEQIDCKNTNTTYIDGRKINTPFKDGVISFAEVIAFSNNIGTAIVAKRVGTKLYDHYTKMGFGKKTNIEFPGEQKGFVNPPKKWSKQSIISLSYGYEITATLLQLTCAFAVIANNGHSITPTLLLDAGHKPSESSLYSPHAMQDIRYILEQTTLKGSTKRAAVKGYTILSKTGTANILIDGQYRPEKNIYTCAGIIEKDGYKRVVVTFIKEASKSNLFAAIVAAPLFERVAQKVLIHDAIIT
jgi:cell division protein FtsI (penicillin-binding protein 3)